MFRTFVELAASLWNPCKFCSCVRSKSLWTLRPRRILKHDCSSGDCAASGAANFDDKDHDTPFICDEQSRTINIDNHLNHPHHHTHQPNCTNADTRYTITTRSLPECWICYDSERTDAGPLLQPCSCKGDVSVVHHECLKQWLIESHSNPELVKCKVCQQPYSVQRGKVWLPAGLTISRCLQTAAIITIMCSTALGLYFMINIFTHVYVRTISVGCAILIEYICLRFLGVNFLSAYHRATFRAINIGGRQISSTDMLQSNVQLPCSTQMIVIHETIAGKSFDDNCKLTLSSPSSAPSTQAASAAVSPPPPPPPPTSIISSDECKKKLLPSKLKAALTCLDIKNNENDNQMCDHIRDHADGDDDDDDEDDHHHRHHNHHRVRDNEETNKQALEIT